MQSPLMTNKTQNQTVNVNSPPMNNLVELSSQTVKNLSGEAGADEYLLPTETLHLQADVLLHCARNAFITSESTSRWPSESFLEAATEKLKYELDHPDTIYVPAAFQLLRIAHDHAISELEY